MKFKFPNFESTHEFFLFLLPIYFVAHGFNENYLSISAIDALKLTAQYLLASLALFFFFIILFKSKRKTALFVFALMCFYFFFGAFHDTLKHLFPSTFIVKYIFILPASLILMVAVFIYF